jgi:hypothetical protein
MRTTLTIIFVFLLTLFSCKKQVEKERPEFIGNWQSSNREYTYIDLDINENSEAVYAIEVSVDSKYSKYKGIARATNRRLKIGRTKYFDIIEYPHLIDTTFDKHRVYDHKNHVTTLANWKMVLEGMKPSNLYLSDKYEFYKAEY